MSRPAVAIRSIGNEREPLVILDGFAPDPDGLRAVAATAPFTPAGEHYPGIRAPLPDDYLRDSMPAISSAITRAFGRCRRVHVLDASFSMVTTPPAALSVKQRLPHVDAFGRDRIAFLQYLDSDGGDGTAFFRHGSTGYETIDEDRAPHYFDQLANEMRDQGDPAAQYITGDTALFQRTTLAEAHYNRALLYRSCLLHSGAISPNAGLSADPSIGRLTITAFLSVE